MTKKYTYKAMAPEVNDMIQLQWMAARYANGRSTMAPAIINQITVRMIENGILLYPDGEGVRQSERPTVWVRDGTTGWPFELIEKYGWDGRKKFKKEKEQ